MSSIGRQASDVLSPSASSVEHRLRQRFGTPSLGNKRNPLRELIYIILSAKTPEAKYQEAYRRLMRRFRELDRLADADVQEIEELIRWAGLARRKAEQIVQLAKAVKDRFGRVTLSPLQKMADAEAEAFLRHLPGVGKKTARCVLMYALDRQVFPVDAHVLRICQRLGWAEEMSAKGTGVHDRLQERIPPELRHSLHVGMVMLGREYCRPRNPLCRDCPMSDACPSSLLLAA
ncbi:MAG: endonuclease III [Armatimonadetes bacterium]|nr:endonuclease III [Armatimonadota bacterium]